MLVARSLGNGLVLRSLLDERDAERFAAFNAECNNAVEGATCRILLAHHPRKSLEDYWIVEDQASGRIVSSTCLIPWTMRFEGIDLRVAMLEMVLTRPEYRGRGLVKTQMRTFEEAAAGCDLLLISGIPYYYRQFGYSYLLDAGVFERLPSRVAAAVSTAADGPRPVLGCRDALPSDAPLLTVFYRESMRGVDLSIERDEGYWRYLISAARFPVRMVESVGTAAPIGYIVAGNPRQGRLSVEESWLTDPGAAQSLLASLLEPGVQKIERIDEIEVSWPAEGPLCTGVRSLGSHTDRRGQWLVKVPDIARLSMKLGPILAGRIRESAAAGFTGRFTVNLYTEAYGFDFDGGRLVRVAPLGFVDASMGADGGDLCAPRDAFLRLLFGYRQIDELYDAWPDITIKRAAEPLLRALFPPRISFVTTPYHFH
jgi:predicted N-acetyltransferase YhbS